MFTLLLILCQENHTLHYSPTSCIIHQKGPFSLILFTNHLLTCVLLEIYGVSMEGYSGTGFHFDFFIISAGTIGPLPLGGCVIKMMLYFYLALIGEVMIAVDPADMSRIGLGRREVDSYLVTLQ